MNKLQYISQGSTASLQLNGIQTVLDGGCKWIQLRYKSSSLTDIHDLGVKVRLLCETYGATFIINDHIRIAHNLDADGVHLGLSDAPVLEARALLGDQKIIGGTANTWQDVLHRINEKVDYIGLGPLRFTSTKEKLSPILGMEGFQNILSQKIALGNTTPIYAIGGVTGEDIFDLLSCGVYGVAVSSALLEGKVAERIIQTFNKKLYGSVDHSG
ncbi:thiamine phosphate synthase [Anditalea andensis]|uniref:Thiamine-phosphate synthase n=1 Tax=Anditalea andensis TaxID=1048983 RepID=A0A074L1K7_9BACT|nr:thiamine phosphate synthase [Anditalea andensis]KEO73738.1 thiamine-phosphate synthase [Anditalea andensis]